MSEPERKYTDEQLAGDDVSKKDLVTFLQQYAAIPFQQEHKLRGQVKNIAKTRSKDQLISAYKQMFEQKAFIKEGEAEAAAQEAADKKEAAELAAQAKKLEIKDKAAGGDAQVEAPKYTKHITKKGNKVNFPMKGDVVSCYYTGKLQDGTVFDSNVVGLKRGKKKQALKFKVGAGHVIKGWDEALLTMSVGETAELTIEPEWAYGKKGVEGKVPPNATLLFEVELAGID